MSGYVENRLRQCCEQHPKKAICRQPEMSVPSTRHWVFGNAQVNWSELSLLAMVLNVTGILRMVDRTKASSSLRAACGGSQALKLAAALGVSRFG